MPQRPPRADRIFSLHGRPGLAGLLLVLTVLIGQMGEARPADFPGVRMRLVNGGVTGAIAHLGLAIDLAPGWHTYWRYPGDSGVPPDFSTDASQNVAGIAVAYPAPVRFGDASDQTIGYEGTVVFGLDVRLTDPATPSVLRLNARLGVCRQICVPVDETLSATITPGGIADPNAVAELADAARLVPVPVAAGDDLSVIDVSRNAAMKPEMVTLRIKGQPAQLSDVFVEGPTGWALPLPTRGDSADELTSWTFALDGLPSGATPKGAALTVTIVGKTRSTTQSVTLP